jgi:hypothetical protein
MTPRDSIGKGNTINDLNRWSAPECGCAKSVDNMLKVKPIDYTRAIRALPSASTVKMVGNNR